MRRHEKGDWLRVKASVRSGISFVSRSCSSSHMKFPGPVFQEFSPSAILSLLSVYDGGL